MPDHAVSSWPWPGSSGPNTHARWSGYAQAAAPPYSRAGTRRGCIWTDGSCARSSAAVCVRTRLLFPRGQNRRAASPARVELGAWPHAHGSGAICCYARRAHGCDHAGGGGFELSTESATLGKAGWLLVPFIGRLPEYSKQHTPYNSTCTIRVENASYKLPSNASSEHSSVP